jgi:hypothetical protein
MEPVPYEKTYEWTRSWFEYANQQTYGANGWAIAAAFGIFVYVMKDAADRLLVIFGVGAAVLLVVFAGWTAAGWGSERDAAFQNLLQLEDEHRPIVSQDPEGPPQQRRAGTFGTRPISRTIKFLTGVIVLAFVVGGVLRFFSIPAK